MPGQRGLHECWRSVQRWLTSISTKIRSAIQGQIALQECWGSAPAILQAIRAAGAESLARVLTQCSAKIGSTSPGQIALQECWGIALRYRTSISAAMKSALSGTGGFELRGVARGVKPLALFCRHLALLALCHLFSRQATRKSDLLYTYSLRACPLALS